MRERRWETTTPLTFGQVLAVGERLAALGLKPAVPAKDVICYVEEWTVESPEDFDQLDAWSTEDVTLIHVREGWRGDFFLLTGAYHTVYQRHQDVGTYCSISHPWRIRDPLRLHDPRSMLWLGISPCPLVYPYPAPNERGHHPRRNARRCRTDALVG